MVDSEEISQKHERTREKFRQMLQDGQLDDREVTVQVEGRGESIVRILFEHLADEPVFALAGGLHFPLTESRLKRRGLQVQMFMGIPLSFIKSIHRWASARGRTKITS